MKQGATLGRTRRWLLLAFLGVAGVAAVAAYWATRVDTTTPTRQQSSQGAALLDDDGHGVSPPLTSRRSPRPPEPDRLVPNDQSAVPLPSPSDHVEETAEGTDSEPAHSEGRLPGTGPAQEPRTAETDGLEDPDDEFDVEGYRLAVRDLLAENSSFMRASTPAERDFADRLGEVWRSGPLQHAGWDCVRLTFELRNDIDQALIVYSLLFESAGDEVTVSLGELRTDGLDLSTTDCIYESARDLSFLPRPDWLAEGESYSFDIATYYEDADHPYQVEMRRRRQQGHRKKVRPSSVAWSPAEVYPRSEEADH